MKATEMMDIYDILSASLISWKMCLNASGSCTQRWLDEYNKLCALHLICRSAICLSLDGGLSQEAISCVNNLFLMCKNNKNKLMNHDLSFADNLIKQYNEMMKGGEHE